MDKFTDRKYYYGVFIVIITLIIVIRLFIIQIFDSTYKTTASSNSRRLVTLYPSRGLIYDRNNQLIVSNQAAYDVMVIPMQVKAFDTVELSRILEIDPTTVQKKLAEARTYSRYIPSIFVKQISASTYAILQEKMHKYPGFYVQTRSLRSYNQKIGTHVLGYVGEVDDNAIKKDEYYKSGDYIGISGIEKSYEEYLRGEKGVEILLVDVKGRVKGSFQDGEHDVRAKVGKDLQITIDAELQAYGELLMNNKTGSIVAIEPATGEILAYVSAPSFSPELLSGRAYSENFLKLSQDPLKPLFNRASQAAYPPGSIFKTVQSLIALQEKVLTPNTFLYCDNSLVGDHAPPGSYNIHRAIVLSSNNFFYKVYKLILEQHKSQNQFIDSEIGFNIWYNHIMTFGLGQKLGTDISHEKGGAIPSDAFYDKWYGDKRWKSSTIISNGIGQGEVLIMPLQMANLSAIIANRGYFYTPHFVRKIDGKTPDFKQFTTQRKTSIDPSYYPIVINAMEEVVTSGTARSAYHPTLQICGKTGTAENPHGKDHSIFIAFAPKDTPKIAIAVYVENSGYGATWAAPIASLMIQKYMNDSINDKWQEERIINANLIEDVKKD